MRTFDLSHHILEHDGCPIHYWLGGPPTVPLVVFIHGATADHHIFDPQIASVTSYFRVLLWDLRGHGQSQPTEVPFSISQSVEDLMAILNEVGYVRAALVGISLGGTVAQEAVRRHPERIIALVNIAAACTTLSLTPLERLRLWLFKLLLRYSIVGMLRRFLVFFAASDREARAYVYRAMCQIPTHEFRTIWIGLVEFYQHVYDMPTYRIPCPVLLLHGRHDYFSGNYQRQMPLWTQREVCASYVIVPTAGHLANWDNPATFNHLLIRFLLQHLSDGSTVDDDIELAHTPLQNLEDAVGSVHDLT